MSTLDAVLGLLGKWRAVRVATLKVLYHFNLTTGPPMKLDNSTDAFAEAQQVAMQNGDKLGALMATGMLELSTALQLEFKKITKLLVALEQQAKLRR